MLVAAGSLRADRLEQDKSAASDAMPAPTHLLGITDQRPEDCTPTEFVADLHCPCGGREFSLLYPGATQEWNGKVYPCTAQIDDRFYFLVRARCAACNDEHLVFDRDFHGWDGFVVHDESQAATPRPPLVPWQCSRCNSLAHRATVRVFGESQAFVMSESDGQVPPDQWQDAFGWITIETECVECGLGREDWVSYEAM